MTRAARWMIVLLGIVLGQFILYGPSLSGRKILLPLDYLARPGEYLPRTAEFEKIVPHDIVLSDLVEQFEPDRLFAAAELRAGRFPWWAPYQYAGAPFVWPKYSPFLLLQSLTASPVILAWSQLATALVAGFGAYAFSRRVLGVSFWPAAIPAWCYPLTGFFVFWQGFPTCAAAYWLPWSMLAVNETVLRPRASKVGWLSVATFLVLVSGHIDVAAQVLLISGLFGLWRWWGANRRRAVLPALTAGWCLGFMLASPHVLPLLEYAKTGARMIKRSSGAEDRPPGDFSALPQVVLPDIYGATRAGSLRIVPGNQNESSAAAYMGVVALLFAAPLAWCCRRHRSLNVFWIALAILGIAWCINAPGFVSLLRLPGLRMMSHNRLVIATSFAVVAMAATGLEALIQGECMRRRWFLLPAALLGGLCGWCFWRALTFPGVLGAGLSQALVEGRHLPGIASQTDVTAVQYWFAQSATVAALFCAAGLLGWICVWRKREFGRVGFAALAAVLVADMLGFARGRSAQCDPELYYPRIPVLEEIAKGIHGRVFGVSCLPAQLLSTHGLDDLRGYDSIDPARMTELLALTAVPESPKVLCAVTQWLVPQSKIVPPDEVHLPPILDMLGVSHLVFRGQPPDSVRPVARSPDYWAVVNRRALPRVFIPQRVEVVPDDRERLQRLTAPEFDARQVAFVESPITIPNDGRGSAKILAEIPTRVTIAVEMDRPGLVVLADNWDPGWNAYVDGKPTSISRTNHALRGVVVSSTGPVTLEFRYDPRSVALGFRLAAGAAIFLVGWISLSGRKSPFRRIEPGLPAN